MKVKKSPEEILSRFLPEQSLAYVIQLLATYKIHLKIKHSRTTKLGDFRPSIQPDKKHQITINHDLNPYAFLVTLIHEIAHAANWNEHKNKVKPHGAEWKKHFKMLFMPLFELNFLPNDIRNALVNYLINPGASSCSDSALQTVLFKYDKQTKMLVNHIPMNSTFRLINGRVFKKGPQKRTRFLCLELTTNRYYLVNQLAEVLEYSN